MIVECVPIFKTSTQTFRVIAWLEDANLMTFDSPMDPARCRLTVVDEKGVELFKIIGEVDPYGTQYVAFEIVAVQLAGRHAYLMEISMRDAGVVAAWGRFPMPTVN
jgi:hypothetical protein